MTISATMVRDLREKTGAGIMECKAALAEASGDMEKAVEVLRKRGLRTAEKKAGRKVNIMPADELAKWEQAAGAQEQAKIWVKELQDGGYKNAEQIYATATRLRGLDSTRLLVLVDGERLNTARQATERTGAEVGLVSPDARTREAA